MVQFNGLFCEVVLSVFHMFIWGGTILNYYASVILEKFNSRIFDVSAKIQAGRSTSCLKYRKRNGDLV